MEPPKPPTVQIVENRSLLTGTIRRIQPQTELPDFVRLVVDVEQVRPVATFADMLSPQQPSSVEVLARRPALPAGLVGQRVEMTVRMAPFAKLFLQDDSVQLLGGAGR